MAPSTKDAIEYERRRLDNIRRNEQMVSALMLKHRAADLMTKSKPLKKPKPKSVIVDATRHSLRARGIPPSENLSRGIPPSEKPSTRPTPGKDPLAIKDAGLIDAIKKSTCGRPESGRVKSEGFDPRSELGLRSDNVRRVVSAKIISIGFLPFVDRTMVVVGSAVGDLGFWDVNFSEKVRSRWFTRAWKKTISPPVRPLLSDELGFSRPQTPSFQFLA